MKYYIFPLAIIASLMISGCIGDDFIDDRVEETVRIMNSIDSLELGTTHQFNATYFNNVGIEESQTVIWSSSDPLKASIDPSGLAEALEIGNCQIFATVELPNKSVTDTTDLVVSPTPVTMNMPTERTGSLMTTSSYLLTGDFTLKETETNLVLEFADNYAASSNLPGLVLYLTNNPNTNNGALEISNVTVFSGAHAYDIPADVELNDYDYVLYYCKPFTVKVGDGDLE